MKSKLNFPLPVLTRLILVMFIFLLLTVAHTIALPLGRGPDELWHFRYMNFIAEYGRLPVNIQERVEAGKKSDWPPLYHSLAGVINSLIQSEDKAQLKIVENSDRADLADMFLSHNLVNTYDEFWPNTGEVLRWRLSRLFASLLSATTIVLVFFAARQVFGIDTFLPLLAAALAAFIPTFVYISAAMSDDPMIGLVGGWYLLALLVMITRGYSSKKYLFGIGLLIGMAIVAKYSALILPLSFTVILTVVAIMQRWGWRAWLARLVAAGLGSVLTCGWWFAYLMINFNETEEFGPVLGLLKPIIAGNMDRTQNQVLFALTGGQAGQEFISKPTPVWQWAIETFRSYWSIASDFSLLNWLILIFVGMVCVVAIIGLVKRWRQQPDARLLIMVLVLHLSFFFFLPLFRFFTIRMLDETAQGRHILFPAVAVVPILILYGWQSWSSPKLMRLVFGVVLASLLLANLGQIISVAKANAVAFVPVYSPQSELSSQISHPTELQFGDRIKLVGYSLDTDFQAGAMKLNLYWMTAAYLDEDYTRQMTLTKDGHDWLSLTSYPANARYPARIWEPDEVIVDELALPLADLPPGEYQLRIQLQAADGPLPVNGDVITNLGQIMIPSLASHVQGVPVLVQIEGQAEEYHVQWWRPDIFSGSTIDNFAVYGPRMMIPLVWQGNDIPGGEVYWNLVDTMGRSYPALSITPHFVYFVTGADWISGEYRLQMVIQSAGEVIAKSEAPLTVRISNPPLRLMTPPYVSSPLEANFANRLKLLGYHLPERFLDPGQPLPIILYWQGVRTMPYDFSYAIKLFDKDHRLISQVDRMPLDGYNTSHWLENEIVVDQFELPQEEIEPVVVWLDLSVYLKRDQEIISLPLVVNQQFTDQTSVEFGPAKIGGAPPGTTASSVFPAQLVEARLGDIIGLQGFDNPQIDGQSVVVNLYWQSLSPTDKNYTVFVHLRDETGAVVAQMDRPPADGVYPTSVWSQGEFLPDKVRVPLPADLKPANYDVVVGLYDPSTGKRLMSNEGTSEILLTYVRVTNIN